MLRTRKKVIALITPANHRRLKGISRLAGEAGWLLNIHDRLEGRAPGFDYDGVLITLRQNENDLKFVRVCRRRKIPVVDLTIQHPELKLPRIVSNHRLIGELGRRHFLERGITNLVWYSSSWSFVHDLRFTGLGATTKIITANTNELRTALQNLPRPCGLLAYNETDAVHALNTALSLGLSIPDDLAILAIGDDDLVLDHQAMTISHIKLNPERSGYAAASLLDRLMRGGDVPDHEILIRPEEIVIGQSTDTYSAVDPIVRQALLYIRDHLQRPFGAAQIADALSISRSRLDKIFSRALGHSIGDEILARRLDAAQRLLINSELNISEISNFVGFCSPTYFVRKFHALTGLSPRRWRTTKH